MKNFKPVTAGNMLHCLEKHSKYRWAKALIDERLQDCLLNEVSKLEWIHFQGQHFCQIGFCLPFEKGSTLKGKKKASSIFFLLE